MFHGEKLEKANVSPELSELQKLKQQKLEKNHKLFEPYRSETDAEKAMKGLGETLASRIAAKERGEPRQQLLEQNKSLFVEYKPSAVVGVAGKTLEAVQISGLTKLERKELQPICTDFLKGYQENLGKPAEGWLSKMLQKYLPSTSEAEAKKLTAEITEDIRKNDAKQKEQPTNGKLDKAAAAVNAVQAGSYLKKVDKAIADANERILDPVLRKDLNVSKNPNLDGFLAERYHAETFNVDAAVKKNTLRAEVLEPDGAYGKNSVDVVVKDGRKIVRKHQLKYGSDAKATERMIKEGDYRGQTPVVPEGQSKNISVKTVERITSPDGKVQSKPLSKSDAKQMQKNVQEGNGYKNDLTYNNSVDMKAMSQELGKQTAVSFLTGVLYGATKEVGMQLANGEKLDSKKIGEASLENGGDFAAKQTLASTLKVASEKELIKAIPKGTSMETITAVSCVAVEGAKIIHKVGTGKLSAAEGVEKAVDTTASTAAGVIASAKGGEIGAGVGAAGGAVISTALTGNPILGKEIGTVVGGIVGSSIGYMFGSGAAEKCVKGAKDMLESLNADEAGSTGQVPQPATV